MDESFIQLLNEGDYEEMNSQLQSSNKKGRSKNFSIQEDMLLISAWENVSLDPIKGNNQSQASYWSRIASFYDEHKSFSSERTPAALTNRWSIIHKNVSKFQGFYNQIEGRNQSGIGAVDKVRQAMEMFQSIQKTSFAFSHCWNELRNSPKFASNVCKKRARPSLNDNPHDDGSIRNAINVECGLDKEGLERPIGRKAAKKLKRMTNEARNEASSSFFADMKEHLSSSSKKRSEEYENMIKLEVEHLELKRKQVEINEAKEKREQQLYEASIMAIDVTKMEQHQATFYNSLKNEILQKRR